MKSINVFEKIKFIVIIFLLSWKTAYIFNFIFQTKIIYWKCYINNVIKLYLMFIDEHSSSGPILLGVVACHSWQLILSILVRYIGIYYNIFYITLPITEISLHNTMQYIYIYLYLFQYMKLKMYWVYSIHKCKKFKNNNEKNDKNSHYFSRKQVFEKVTLFNIRFRYWIFTVTIFQILRGQCRVS